jgi:sortase A
VLGELLITAGVFVLLFLGWQLWFNDLVVGGEHTEKAQALTDGWLDDVAPVEPAADGGWGEPVVAAEPTETATTFATVYIPRFGADYAKPIAQGVGTRQVLNPIGVGHYPGTQMPGEVGNFAIAAHRTTWGAPFAEIASLQLGDKIYVATADGIYTYVYRDSEYVAPTGVEVIDPVPHLEGVAPTDRLITLTSCNPRFSAAERIIAHGVLESWQPLGAEPPAEIAHLLPAAGGA